MPDYPVTVTLPDGIDVPATLLEQREARTTDRWWCLVRTRIWGSEIGDYIHAALMWVPAQHVHRVDGADYTDVPTTRLGPQDQWGGGSA